MFTVAERERLRAALVTAAREDDRLAGAALLTEAQYVDPSLAADLGAPLTELAS